MSRFRTIATAAALAGTAALAVVATSTAQASDTNAAARWCNGSDLAISVEDMRSPTVKDKAHKIKFVSAEGASCRFGGTVSNVRFLDAQGRKMDVSLTGGQPKYYEGPVDEDRYVAIYVASKSEGPQSYPAFVRFDLPGQGRLGDLVTIPWPKSGLGSPVNMSGIMPPVS